MALLAAHKLNKSFGAKQILKDAEFSIKAGERVGLVGANGTGKSSLGRILAQVDTADSGQVLRRRDCRLAYLAQEPDLGQGSARQVAALGLRDWSEARAEYDRLTQRLEQGGAELESLLEQQQHAATEVERLGGWELLHRVDDYLARLAIINPEQEVSSMSGGEQRRVALAQLLVSQPDLAILDEPTNHLDAETIEWLEQHLSSEFRGALLLITHDRYVLDRVAKRTVELADGKLHSYEGGWEEYLTAKAERAQFEARTEANRQNFLRSELEWLRRQPKARTGKQKARIKRAESAQAAEKPASERSLEFQSQTARLGSTILEFDNLGLEIAGKRLIDSLDFKMVQGERLGILGRNGCGKSSLLRAVLGELKPRAGSIKLGKNSQIAYFDQNRSNLADNQTVRTNIAGDADTVRFNGKPVSIYNYLERFGFRGQQLLALVGSLSGGERARIALAKFFLTPANLLLLDEPTNDLDVQTLATLEATLLDFRGCALIVTHDRYFLNRVVTSILAFEDEGNTTRYLGNFDNYLSLRPNPVRAGAPKESKKHKKAKAAEEAGLTNKEKRELERLEQQVEQLEAESDRLEGILGAPETYAPGSAVDTHQVNEALRQVKTQVADAMARWEALETKRE